MEIVNVNEKLIWELKEFLKCIPSIDEIDDIILKNAVIAKNDKGVNGAVSYEKIGIYGLIRYFVFKKELLMDDIKNLFYYLEENAKKENIVYLFSITNFNGSKDLFFNLDFKEIDKNNVFIDEECFTNSKYKNALIMARKIG